MRRPRILIISNGHGEDSIGAEIARRLVQDAIIEAYPTLGDGGAYRDVCAIVGPRARLASEGSRAGTATILGDVLSGGLATIPPGLAFMRRARGAYDRVLVVGDLIGVIGAWLAGLRDIVYVDVYRSGYGRHYLPPERAVMAATCGVVFCRSDPLAASLASAGIDARYAGNVMMDTIPFGDYDAATRRRARLAVTLLPGSRASAPANFALQLAALRALPEALRPDLFLALAPGADPGALAQAADMTLVAPDGPEAADRGRLSGDGLTIHLTQGALGNLLENSDLVLSQAGTASIQAAGSGRPVLSFREPRARAGRQRDLAAMFGTARIVTDADPADYGKALRALLADDADRRRRGAFGRERLGGSGAIAAIIAQLR